MNKCCSVLTSIFLFPNDEIEIVYNIDEVLPLKKTSQIQTMGTNIKVIGLIFKSFYSVVLI